MKTLVVANQKGGVGKTTLARNITYFLSEQHRRVLAIDFDPQGNMTRSLIQWHMTVADNAAELTASNSSELFVADAHVVPMKLARGVSLLAGSHELTDVMSYSADASLVSAPKNIHTLKDEFDVCVIDTPPTWSNLIGAGLASADYVLMPCDIDEDATDGLSNLADNIALVKEHFNPGLQVIGVLPNKVNRRRHYDVQNLARLRSEYADLILDFELQERTGTKLSKSKPVWHQARGESDRRAAREMRAVCAEIATKIGMGGQ